MTKRHFESSVDHGLIHTGFSALAETLGILLVVVSLPVLILFACVKIDTPEDRAICWIVDTILGLLLATGIALLSFRRIRTLANLGQAAIIWMIISGSLFVWHEYQVQVRWTVPKRILALNQVRIVENALHEYAEDCGGFPNKLNGLVAVVSDPGISGWAGPYLDAKSLTDPWGNSLQYKRQIDWVEVWSQGPDGTSATEDDIRVLLK